MSQQKESEDDLVLAGLRQRARDLGFTDCADKKVSPVFLDAHSCWDSVMQSVKTAHVVGLDTEFVREKTFVPGLALFQLSFPGQDQQYLVDALEPAKVSHLLDDLMPGRLTKVMHGCSEDLEIFLHQKGGLPENLFDTQIAVSLLGARRQTGYTGLVCGVFGAIVDKAETRSDWFQRPLTEDQIRYAARDVLFLLPLYEVLVQALKDMGRLGWLEDEMLQLKHNVAQITPPEQYYQKIANHWRLRPKALYLLQQICAWRESEARVQNIPRGFLVSDSALGEIARHFCTNERQLKQIKALKPAQRRVHGPALLEQITQICATMPPGAGQNLPVIKPLPKVYQPLLKLLKHRVNARAKALGIEANLLLGKRYLLEFFSLACEQVKQTQEVRLEQMTQSPWLSGWRRDQILAELVEPLRDGLLALDDTL